MRRGALAAIAIVAFLPAYARAFPELAVQAGARRCNGCHFAPAGGGLINARGRDEAGDLLSRGGDGSFLHGAWIPPSWLALGGDLRGAALVNDAGAATGPETAVFPMEADLRVRLHAAPFSLIVTAGPRGSTRWNSRGAADWLVSAEHYLLYQPSSEGPYARVGRFAPPMGLRLPDHTLYIRSQTGLDLYEEPYALGVGWLANDWEAHATAFVHDPILDVGRDERGTAAYAELHRPGWAIGAGARLGFSDEATRVVGDLVLRIRLPARLALLAEGDVIEERVHSPAGDSGRTEVVGYAGLDLELVRGLRLDPWIEHDHEDIGVPGLARNAVGLSARWFPWAHFEIILYGRWQLVGSDAQAKLAMLQLHYYL
jgi:hypothetical protein